MSKEEMLEILKTAKVDYVRLELVDLLGNVRGKSLRRVDFEENLDVGFVFPDDVLTRDYADRPIKESDSDIVALPDASSFTIIPYLERTSRVLSYITSEDGTPHPNCSRGILKRVVNKADDEGINIVASFTLSFYLLKESKGKVIPADFAKAYSPEGLLIEQEVLKNMMKNLELLGVPVQRVTKSLGPGQYEVKLLPVDIMTGADYVVKAKEVITEIANMHGMAVTFMPKPFHNYPCNYAEVSLSLLSQGKNLLENRSDPNGVGLSEAAYDFVGGIIHHLPAIMAFSMPTINSYKRLVENKMIAGIGKGKNFILSTSYEYRHGLSLVFRAADPLFNVYIALASILHAGFNGKPDHKVTPGIPLNSYPKSLDGALEELRTDLVINAIGNATIATYLTLKERELKDFSSYVTDWELKNYLRTGW
ncbi:glutamine synthetase [Sulfolobales archaeon HS-7]|nr:glutamine synthetase [Sulfolobales archaeon HS-7]